MNWIYIVLFSVAAVILFILFAGINISFAAEYKEKHFDIKIRVYILNSVFGKNIKLPKKPKTENEKPTETSDTDAEACSSDTDNVKKSIKELLDNMKTIFEKYVGYKDAFFMIRERIRKKFVFKSLNIFVDYGDGDAHSTAVSIGTVWGLIYNLLGFVTKTATVKNHTEKVTPQFDRKVFTFGLDGILRVRLVHIIYTFIIYKLSHKKILNKGNNPVEKKKGV